MAVEMTCKENWQSGQMRLKGTYLIPAFKNFDNCWWIKKKKSVSDALKVNATFFVSVDRLFLDEVICLFKWEVGKGYFQKSATQSNKG